MAPLQIQPTDKSPAILLDAQSGKLSFTGRAFPENSLSFFEPVIAWLAEYYIQPAEKTECYMKLEYFNSASKKCFVEIFKILRALQKKTHSVHIIWAYDEGDESIMEIGEEYEAMFKLGMEFRSE